MSQIAVHFAYVPPALRGRDRSRDTAKAVAPTVQSICLVDVRLTLKRQINFELIPLRGKIKMNKKQLIKSPKLKINLGESYAALIALAEKDGLKPEWLVKKIVDQYIKNQGVDIDKFEKTKIKNKTGIYFELEERTAAILDEMAWKLQKTRSRMAYTLVSTATKAWSKN